MFVIGYFVVAFRMHSQPDQGWSGDNTGLNNIEVKCRGAGMTGTHEYTVTGHGTSSPGSYWGSYSSTCPSGQAACWVHVKTETNHGMTDLQIKCCDY